VFAVGRNSRLIAALLIAMGAASSAPVSRASAATPNSIPLQWTATGDDGDVGQAYRYDLRYRTSDVVGGDTSSWWSQATTATGLPAPSTSGATDSATVNGLTPATTYYFVLRVYDEVGNVSPFSNLAVGTTLEEILPPPPGCSVPATAPSNFTAADSGDVFLSWSPTSDPLATEFHIFRAVGSAGTLSRIATITDPSQTTFRDTNVSTGTPYRYRAAWASSCGDGPATSSVPITLSAPPGTPPPGSAGTATLHAYPNPSSGAVQFAIKISGSAPQQVYIRLFDMSGRWVADIANGTFQPGTSTISWARTARSGGTIAPGYYEAIGVVGGAKLRERLVLLP